MAGVGVVWKIVKTAATRIPWATVLENAPIMVDLMGRARERMMPPGHRGVEEQLRALHEENLKLTKQVAEASEGIEQLTRALEVISARQRMLTIVSIVSLLTAVSSLLLWLVR